MSLREEFNSAVKAIQNLPKEGHYQPSTSTKLKFYGFFKQVTEGKCKIPQPPFYQAVARAKWNAWNALGDLSEEDAMKAYLLQYDDVLRQAAAVAPPS